MWDTSPSLVGRPHTHPIPRDMVAWTHAFLEDRTAILLVNDSEFPYPIQAGVPQGSPLSPILFLVFIDDLLQKLPQVVHCQAFSNDLFIWDIVPTRGTCPKGLQDALLMVATWSTQWGMIFNVTKC